MEKKIQQRHISLKIKRNYFFLLITSIILIGTVYVINHYYGEIIFQFCQKISNFFIALFNGLEYKTFIPQILAFEIAVIALSVPLSYQIVSRISERYNSDIISSKFLGELEIRIFPKYLIINIFLNATILIFPKEFYGSFLKLFSLFLYFCFIISLIFLYKFINKLIKYVTSSDYILERMYTDAKKIFEE